jgi:tRNA pseudouridine65 synthase
MHFPVLYKDEFCIAIHKPSGIHVHRSELAPHEPACLNLLRDQIGEWVTPVHRIDRAASGIVLFALSPESSKDFFDLFLQGKIEKKYQVIVRGWCMQEQAIHYAISADHRPKKDAHTDIIPLQTAELPIPTGKYPAARISLVQARLHTGRRHQIRMHCAHLRHPVLGDVRYGDGAYNKMLRQHFGLNRLLLFSAQMKFIHPITGQPVHVECNPLAYNPDLLSLWQAAGWHLPADPLI